jgi:hypothetical protein
MKNRLFFVLVALMLCSLPVAADMFDIYGTDQSQYGQHGQYGQAGQHGQYGQTGQHGQYGQTGQHGQYGSYQHEQPKKCGGFFGWFKPKPCAHKKQANAKLIQLVRMDLQLCLGEIEGKRPSYLACFPAMGHINHARSALDKIRTDRYDRRVIEQIRKRLGHVRFYLVMYNFNEATDRVYSLLNYLNTVY